MSDNYTPGTISRHLDEVCSKCQGFHCVCPVQSPAAKIAALEAERDRLARELEGACEHVGRLCEERHRLRTKLAAAERVVEAARNLLHTWRKDCDCQLCEVMRQFDAAAGASP